MAKVICTKKTPWTDLSEEDQKKGWNVYMINRILSMNPDLIELVDYMQMHSNMPAEFVYKTYCDLLPDTYQYSPFVKASNKVNLKAVASYFNISTREAMEYLPLIPKDIYDQIITEYDEELVESHKMKKNGTAL